MKARIALFGVVLATALAASGPASAQHHVTIHHQEPPTVIAGQDATLLFAVENDGLWGSALATLRFWDADGLLHHIVRVVENAPPANVMAFTIDAQFVPDEPGCGWFSYCAISYELEIETEHCVLAYDCHTASAKTPLHTVSVTGLGH